MGDPGSLWRPSELGKMPLDDSCNISVVIKPTLILLNVSEGPEGNFDYIAFSSLDKKYC